MRSISCQPSCPPGLVPAWRLAWGMQWIVGQLRPRRWPLHPRQLQLSTGLGPECRGRHLCLPPHYQGYFSSMVTNTIFFFSLLFHEWQYPTSVEVGGGRLTSNTSMDETKREEPLEIDGDSPIPPPPKKPKATREKTALLTRPDVAELTFHSKLVERNSLIQGCHVHYCY